MTSMSKLKLRDIYIVITDHDQTNVNTVIIITEMTPVTTVTDYRDVSKHYRYKSSDHD